MRTDLDHAYASLEWVVEQLPPFEMRMWHWLLENKVVEIGRAGNSAEFDPVLVSTASPLPLRFKVEAGAYLNTIRSSLDILATTLAARTQKIEPHLAFFPFAKTKARFEARSFPGRQFMESISPAASQIITNLQPYRDGNFMLWSIHKLDNLRKHQRLLTAHVSPRMLSLPNVGLQNGDVTTAQNWTVEDGSRTVVAMLKRSAPRYTFDAILQINFAEPDFKEGKRVTETLTVFCAMVRDILNLF